MDFMNETKTCIYPGCERPAVPPHPLGGPQPAFCDREDHNALTAHQERQRLAGTSPPTPDRPRGT
jgi:colicin import membrane protein